MKRFFEQLCVVVVVAAVLGMAAGASAELLNFGTLTNLTGVGNLDLTGTIVYAIDVGGPGRTLSGVTFNRDNNPYSPSETGLNNGTPGSWQSTWTTGYYPALNSPGNWNTSFSGNADLDAIMSYGRNDSGTYRISQFDIVSGYTYKLQVLAKSAGTEDRRMDLSVGTPAGGLGTPSDLGAWAAATANFAVDDWQESTPKVWSYTFVATSNKLWINNGNAGAGPDPNPIINAFIVTQVAVPEPSTLVLLATGLIGLLAYAWRRRS